jgi:hypothetical protein
MNQRLLRACVVVLVALAPASAFAELQHVTIKVLGMD